MVKKIRTAAIFAILGVSGLLWAGTGDSGVPGNSDPSNGKYKGNIEINSFSWGGSNRPVTGENANGTKAGKADLSNLTITKVKQKHLVNPALALQGQNQLNGNATGGGNSREQKQKPPGKPQPLKPMGNQLTLNDQAQINANLTGGGKPNSGNGDPNGINGDRPKIKKPDPNLIGGNDKNPYKKPKSDTARIPPVENTLNIGSQSSGAGAGKIKFNPFSITKKTDKAGPNFFGQTGASGGTTTHLSGHDRSQLKNQFSGKDPGLGQKSFMGNNKVAENGFQKVGPGAAGIQGNLQGAQK